MPSSLLPLRATAALVWQDAGGKTWLSYNNSGWIAQRYELGHAVDPTAKSLTGALDALAKAQPLLRACPERSHGAARRSRLENGVGEEMIGLRMI